MNKQEIINTIKHSLFMLAELPIGIFYFTFAVTGLALSVGLVPVFIGIPLFIGIMGFAGLITKFEYARCHALLTEMPAPLPDKGTVQTPKGLFNRTVHALTHPDGWKGIVIMLLKLPIGIASFAIIVTLISLSAGLLAYPLVYYILLDAIQVDIYENSLIALLTDLGPTESSILYFCIGLLVSYGVIRIVPSISRAFLKVTVQIIKL